MESTDHMIFGLRDGRCVAAGWQQSGEGADEWNRDVRTDWAKRGMDILTLHKDDPQAKRYIDQMWDCLARK